VFIAGFDPDYVEQAPLHRLYFWHERFFRFTENREASRAELIAQAVKQLPR
jgi:hypothetical protein